MLSRPVPADSSYYNIQKKYSLTYLRRTVCVAIEEKVRGKIFGSTGGQTSKNDPILLAMVSKCSSSKYNEKPKYIVCPMWYASLLQLLSKTVTS